MPTYITGPSLRNNINQDQLIIDMQKTVAMKAPKVSPILLLGKRPTFPYGMTEKGAVQVQFNERVVTNYEFKWLEDDIRPRTTTLNQAGVVAGTIILTVTDANPFQTGDLVKDISTGEIIRVDEVNITASTIKVTRSFGTTAAANMTNGDTLLIIGNVNAENSTSRASSDIQKTTVSNYIQKVRHPFSGSKDLQNQDLYTGDERTYKRKKFLLEHLYDIESSLVFAEKKQGTEYNGNGELEYASAGLLSFLTQNNTAVGGALTKTTFNTWLRGLFKYGSDEKILFCSTLVAGVVNDFAGDTSTKPAGTIYVENLAKAFGINIMTYTTKFGVVHLVQHGLLDGTVFGGYAIGVDPGNLQLVKVRGGDYFNMYTDIQENDRDGWKDEYRTLFGLQYEIPASGGVLTGVTG